MNTVISFPVKSYIYKYLACRYGMNFTYTKISALAPIIRNTLSKNFNRELKSFTTSNFYKIELTPFYINKYGVFFDSKTLYQFNRDVDLMFREELFQFMNFNKEFYNISYRTSLRDYFKKFKIYENDLKIETILRDFTRKNEVEADLVN